MNLKDLKLTPQNKKSLWMAFGILLALSGAWAYLRPNVGHLSLLGSRGQTGINSDDVALGYLVDDEASYLTGETEAQSLAQLPSAAGKGTDGKKATKSSLSKPTDSEKKIMKDGHLSMEVSDLDETREAVEELALTYDGFISSYQEYGTDNDRSISMTIKVPVDKFSMTVDMIRKMADDITSASTSANDVTDQYVDTQARLDNEMAYEAQLITVLDKAETVEDILAVQAELNVVREKIERLEAQIDYLEDTTDYSSVYVDLSLSPEDIVVNPEKWSGVAVAKEALAQLIILGKEVLTLVIWLLIYSPAIIAVALLYKIVRWSRMKVENKGK